MPSSVHTDIHDLTLGKVFYLELDGEGKVPVLHFGMTGAIQVWKSFFDSRAPSWLILAGLQRSEVVPPCTTDKNLRRKSGHLDS